MPDLMTLAIYAAMMIGIIVGSSFIFYFSSDGSFRQIIAGLAFIAVITSPFILTLAWTLSGHCCGSPIVGTDWDACMPVQNRQWPDKYMPGHCDETTWKRVYP